MDFEFEALFLLGAGASKPYGYPTGAELKDQIIDQCINGGELIEILTALGHYREDITSLGEQFRNASTTSIDAFLKNRNEFSSIGKAAISYFILEAERNISKHFPNKEDWLGHLLGRVIENKKKSFENRKLNFITFNYDRVLQFRLLKCVESRFGLNSYQAAAIVRKYMIHHVYGSIANLPDLHEVNKLSLQMQTGQIIPHHCKLSSRNIKVMHEERQADESEKIFDNPMLDYFYKSNKIYILGFGFDKDNMHTLGIDWSKVAGEVYVTAYDCGNAEIEQIKNLMLGCKNLTIEKWTCLEMLKENLVTL